MLRLYFLFLSIVPIGEHGACPPADTDYILIKVRDNNSGMSELDKGKWLANQFSAAIRKELRKPSVVLIEGNDSVGTAGIRFSHVIELILSDIRIDDELTDQQSRHLSREVTSNNFSDETEDQRKQHAEVSADMIITQKNISGYLNASIIVKRVSDASMVMSDFFNETFKWENKYATFTGSQQALGNKELELIRLKPKPVPTRESVYKELVKQLINKSSRKVAAVLQ